MITKTASRIISTRFEKQANFILGHALQNLYGRASLRFPKLFGTEKMFLRNMVKPEQGMSTMRGNAAFGLAKGVVPEVGIMNEQFGRLGKNLGENLAQKGISLSELDNRDIVVLRRLLRGDFVKALESNSPRANELVTAMIGALRPELKPLVESGIITPGVLRKQLKKSIRSVDKNNINASFQEAANDSAITPEQAQQLLEGMGKVWKDNRLTSNLSAAIDTRASERLFGNSSVIPGFLGKFRKKGLAQKLREASRGEDNPVRARVRMAGDVAGNATLALADPGTFGLNMVKRIADDHHIMPRLKAGRVVQENLQDFFAIQPMQKSFSKGLNGNYVTPFHVAEAPKQIAGLFRDGGLSEAGKQLWNYTKETADSQIMNPFTSAAKNLSNGFGKAIHDAGITQEQLAQAAARGATKYPILGKMPAQPKALSNFVDFCKAAPKNAGNALMDGLGGLLGIGPKIK